MDKKQHSHSGIFCYDCVAFLLFSLVLMACAHDSGGDWEPSREQTDSILFSEQHHYNTGFNFIVTADSLNLLLNEPGTVSPEMQTAADTFTVRHGSSLVVAEMLRCNTDSIDSLWVRVANDQYTIGWVCEADLLEACLPDDSVSLVIDWLGRLFSWPVLLLCVAVSLFCFRLLRQSLKQKQQPVTPGALLYPVVFLVAIASDGVVLGLAQSQTPDLWMDYFYNPTLNPFEPSGYIAAFLFLFWAILILMIAMADDLLHHLSVAKAAIVFMLAAALSPLVFLVAKAVAAAW